MRILSVTQSIICSAKGKIAVLKSLKCKTWHLSSMRLNPSTHIEVIDEESVKLMQLEYGNPVVTPGDQRYTAYGNQVVKGSLKGLMVENLIRKMVTTLCRTLIPIQHLNF